jgi:hypothetical protein
MSFILAMPNGQVLLTILIIGIIGLVLTSMGALLGIWTWKTPQSIIVLIVGAALVFFVANFVLIDSTIG